MPAAVSENTPQDVFGLNLANRRCSVWRATCWPTGPASLGNRIAASAALRRPGQARSEPVTEPPGGSGKALGQEPPPDGTTRRPRRRYDGAPVPSGTAGTSGRKARGKGACTGTPSSPMRRASRCGTHGAMAREVLRRHHSGERTAGRTSVSTIDRTPGRASVGLAETPAPFAFRAPAP